MRARAVVLGCAAWLWSGAAFAANDTAVHFPPQYDSFLPPAVGQSYTDPVFGVALKRASDARNMANHAASGFLSFVSTEYSTASPFNSNGTWLILQHQGYFGLYDGSGNYIRDLPFAVNAGTEPRWSRSDPNVLYYIVVNDLMKLDVAAGTSSVVRSFGEYAAIRGRGESDISRDGDHFVFAADERNGPVSPGLANRYVFVYQISTDTKGPVLDTIGHSFDQLYITPSNGVMIGWYPPESGTARFTGLELFDRNMVFQRQLTRAIGHMHQTRDSNGDDVVVWSNSGDPSPIPNCQNGIVKVRLSDARQTCLLQLDWSLAVHITAGDGNGWVFVGTYDPADPAPAAPGWKLYTNEILQVKLDGSEVRRLLHHRSRPLNSYEYQPRANVSRDGTKLVYTSNYNLPRLLGYSDIYYSDVYFIAVPTNPIPPQGPLTCPASVPPAASLAATVTGGASASDWVAMYPSGQAAHAPWLGSYQYVALPRPQTLTFTAPATLGSYELRLFANNTFTLLGSCPFSVVNSPALSINDVTVAEGNAGTLNATFTVALSPATSATVSVDYATANGTATAGTDYVAKSGTLTFAPGDAPKTVSVVVNGDTTIEGNETFFVNLSNATGGALIGDAQGRGTISNDEGPLSCPATASPGTSFTTTVTGGSSAADWVALTTQGSGISSFSSYQYVPLPRPQTRTFTAPATPGTYELRLFANDTFTLLGSCLFPVAVGPSFTISDVTVTEGNAGTVSASFSVALSPAASGTVTVDYATANGTALAGSDYVATSGTLSFAPGAPPKTITVLVNGDTGAESNETFFVNLSNATGGSSIADAQGRGTITNDEAPLSCPAMVSPGASFTTSVTGGSSASDWVAIFPVGQAANSPWLGTLQYVPMPRPQIRSFTAPATPGSYELRLFANDTFSVLGSCSFPVAVGPSLVIGDVTLIEGNAGTVSATFVVSLSPAASGTVTVDYATANGTATAGSDYVATSGMLSFAPGAPPKTISVLVNGDTTAESNETFFVNLSNATGGAALGDSQGQATIANDEGPLSCPGTVLPSASFTTTVTGGSSSTDWVAMYPAAQAAHSPWLMSYQYVPMPRPRTRTFTAPATPGTYQLRLFANDTFTLLGSCSFSVGSGS